jgi:hypothetical protein
MSLDEAKEAPTDDAVAAAEGGGEKLSKKQLKKLAKGKVKKDKPKPTWGEPGQKKKSKEEGGGANKAISLPKREYVNDTPKGEKKRLGEMEEAYHPVAVESAWQDWWEARYVTCYLCLQLLL